MFFFCCGSFLLVPASLVSRKFFAVGPGCAKCVFVLLRSVGRRDLSAGPEQKKNTTQGVFFFALAPPKGRGAQRGFSFPCLSPGPQQKTKIPWVVFFFCCGPARTLTHSLRAWVAMPPPRRGGVFFFCCGPARTGVVFFFLLWPRPDAHSLTVGWGDFGKARVVFCFLLLPRRVFLDNNKKCLGYYIGSKMTRRGHSKKKKTPLP